jgi:hypothetical protein
VSLLILTYSLLNLAGPREQAWRIHNRLAGTPPGPAVLAQMESFIRASQPQQAVMLAMNNSGFYNITLKNWFKRWTNVDQTNRVPLNDFVATAIGMVRDNIPFNTILSADLIYRAPAGMNGVEEFTIENNDHYEDLENKNIDLMNTLIRRVQSQETGIAQTAGVMTTRAAAEAFLSAGTNRRMNRFAFMNFLCHDYEALHDVNLPDVFVRKDVDRRPGGDSRTFKNKCVGCHAGQDSLAGAWAYYDYTDGRITYAPGIVSPKINLNNLFNDGHQVVNDSWSNLWAQSTISSLGWQGNLSGNGAMALGQMLTRSQAFGQCMAEQAFKVTCLKKPINTADINRVKQFATEFETTDSYNMKKLLVKTATICVGE